MKSVMTSRYYNPLPYLLLIQLLFSVAAYPQSKKTITLTGKVIDKSSDLPLEFATVSVIDLKTGKTITGTVTDAKGAFGIPGITSGSYRINAGYIGYKDSAIDSIYIKGNRSTVSVGTFYLLPSTTSLQNVVVTGDRPVIENKIDKIVYNTSNDITSMGGQAMDVLKKVPQVTVDLDGNVELQGNSNIRFLIDGKPSSVFGSDLAEALASIPASQIKSIEVITNPGAKYDSQGTGGIINIILKENNAQGVNGSINLAAGTRLENGSANFNFRRSDFGLHAFFSGHARLKSQVPNSQTRTTLDTTSGSVTYLSQNGSSDYWRHGFRSGLGFDWTLARKNIFTGSFGYSHYGRNGSGITDLEEMEKDFLSDTISDIQSIRESENKRSYRSLDWDLNYKRKFGKDGQELDILYSASDGRPDGNYIQTQTYLGEPIPYTGSASSNPGSNRETDLSVDYTHPFSDDFLLETGIKGENQDIYSKADVSIFKSEDNMFVHDPLQSYSLNYKMRIYAGYISFAFPLFHYLKIKAGSRYEYTDVSIDDPGTSIPSYGTFVPSFIISHNFSKNSSLKISYGKRIQRPRYRQLNPFLDISDPYNISTGNPLLKPEIGRKIELGFSSVFKKGGNIYIALIERFTSQDMKRVTEYYPTYMVGDTTYTNVAVTNYQNVGHEYNTGLSVSASFPLTQQLNLRGTLMMFHRYMTSDLSFGNKSTGLRTRLHMNATYRLPEDLVLEAFGFYSAPSHSIQGKIPQFFIYTLAFRKLFWDKKASIGVTATNFLSQYIKQVSTISSEGYRAQNERQLPFRSFGISLSYKFGKLEFKNNGQQDNEFPANESSGGSYSP